jgi:hypothetical protein
MPTPLSAAAPIFFAITAGSASLAARPKPRAASSIGTFGCRWPG